MPELVTQNLLRDAIKAAHFDDGYHMDVYSLYKQEPAAVVVTENFASGLLYWYTLVVMYVDGVVVGFHTVDRFFGYMFKRPVAREAIYDILRALETNTTGIIDL